MQLDQSNNATHEPSEVVSRYLEAIYYMWSEKEPLRSARLADWLGVSRPTVAVGLRRMTRYGLVHMNSRKEIELTPSGMTAAESIVRRHRIMERWLTDALGLDWVTADAEAARLEHAVTDVVEQRLYEVLGRPKTCPHGNPIPGYSEAASDEVRLSSLAAGAQASVTRVSTIRPARVFATRRASSNWSAKSGTMTSGTPAANAASVVPEPPWQTTRSAWSRRCAPAARTW